MFGKPEWFRKKKTGWGLIPVATQGWAWAGGWLAAIVLPFWALVAADKTPEAGLWMAALIGLCVWEVRRIIKALDAAEASNVLHINDDNADHVVTRKYDLHLRD